MTPADIIVEARRLLQDTTSPYRYSDADLLGFVNQTLKRMAVLRPDLFGVIGEVATAANSAIQDLPADALRLIDVFQVKGGNTVLEVDRETLSRSNPAWMTATADQPQNYMRHVKNPKRFFLYPPPTTGVMLLVEYAQVPAEYALDADIEAPSEAFLPVVVDGVVFLAESIDNEHVSSGRAKLFLEAFSQSLTTSLQSRIVTDTKSAGMRQRATNRRGMTVEGDVI